MNRPLTYLSAAVCFAAGTVGSSFAAPSGESASIDAHAPVVVSTASDVKTASSLTADEVIRSGFDRGFASIDPSPESAASHNVVADTNLNGYANQRLTADVSEFISPQWRTNDNVTDAFFAAVQDDERQPFAQPSFFTSSDAQMLSVPEIPLPIGVIPGIVGVGLAAIAHRRSLHRRKMAR